jgi:hypothetical protein
MTLMCPAVHPGILSLCERENFPYRHPSNIYLSIRRPAIGVVFDPSSPLPGTGGECPNIRIFAVAARRETADLLIENARLKARRNEKNKQMREWRAERALLYDFIKLLREYPDTPIPKRQWPPPDWRYEEEPPEPAPEPEPPPPPEP